MLIFFGGCHQCADGISYHIFVLVFELNWLCFCFFYLDSKMLLWVVAMDVQIATLLSIA
jgi:hypothetical protein